jgi:FkbM family methyltransferase
VASGLSQVKLLAAAAGAANGELLMETDADNLGASHVASGQSGGHTFRVPAFTLQQILSEAGVASVDALKIDIEGFEDRVLTSFFANAPQALWPRAVVIEHLSRKEWQQDCIDDMIARGYREVRKTRSNTLLSRG